MSKPILNTANAFYCVSLRTVSDVPLFLHAAEYQCFAELMESVAYETRSSIHAYTLLPDSAHIVLYCGVPIMDLLRRLCSEYLSLSGQPVEVVRKPELVFDQRVLWFDGDLYLMEMVRHLHWLPVSSGVAAHLDEHIWTSHVFYRDADLFSWLSISSALDHLPHDEGSKVQRYRRFMDSTFRLETGIDLEQGNHHRFRAWVAEDAVDLSLVEPVLSNEERQQMQWLVSQVCREFGCDEDELNQRRRNRLIDRAKALISRLALENDVASVHALANRFHVTEQSVREMAEAVDDDDGDYLDSFRSQFRRHRKIAHLH